MQEPGTFGPAYQVHQPQATSAAPMPPATTSTCSGMMALNSNSMAMFWKASFGPLAKVKAAAFCTSRIMTHSRSRFIAQIVGWMKITRFVMPRANMNQPWNVPLIIHSALIMEIDVAWLLRGMKPLVRMEAESCRKMTQRIVAPLLLLVLVEPIARMVWGPKVCLIHTLSFRDYGHRSFQWGVGGKDNWPYNFWLKHQPYKWWELLLFLLLFRIQSSILQILKILSENWTRELQFHKQTF